jgi:hypothetical protein
MRQKMFSTTSLKVESPDPQDPPDPPDKLLDLQEQGEVIAEAISVALRSVPEGGFPTYSSLSWLKATAPGKVCSTCVYPQLTAQYCSLLRQLDTCHEPRGATAGQYNTLQYLEPFTRAQSQPASPSQQRPEPLATPADGQEGTLRFIVQLGAQSNEAIGTCTDQLRKQF